MMGVCNKFAGLLIVCCIALPVYAEANLGKLVRTASGPCLVDKVLRCFDKNLDQVRWEIPDYSDAHYLAEHSGILVVATDVSVLAFNTRTGDVLWQWRDSESSSEKLFEPYLHKNAVYLTTEQGSLIKLSLYSGESIWRIKLHRHWIYPPAISNNVIVTGGRDHRLWGVNEETGEIVWETPLNAELVYRPVTIDQKSVLVPTFDRQLLKVDSHSGDVIWSVKNSSPTVYLKSLDNSFIAGGYDGAVTLYNSEYGERLWQQSLYNSPIYWFSVEKGKLATVDESGHAFILQLTHGKRLSENRMKFDFESAPLITKDAIYYFPKGKDPVRETKSPEK